MKKQKRELELELERKWRHYKREKKKNNNLSEICIWRRQIKKWKNKEKYKNSWEIEKGNFSRILIFILVSDSTSTRIIIVEIKTKTFLILMKSSYPTYHNNKIEEENKTTLFTYHTHYDGRI